jgi:hypothetical protein
MQFASEGVQAVKRSPRMIARCASSSASGRPSPVMAS